MTEVTLIIVAVIVLIVQMVLAVSLTNSMAKKGITRLKVLLLLVTTVTAINLAYSLSQLIAVAY